MKKSCLGSSVYADGEDDAVKQFILDNKANNGKIVNFNAAALVSSTYKRVKELAEENGIAVGE